MKRLIPILVLFVTLVALVGCTTPSDLIKDISLGMTPDEVKDEMGDPYTVRAAKVYDNGETMMVYEYLPPVFTFNPKTYWILFENGKVVQWGEPGDLTGKAQKVVSEYNEQKMLR